MKMPLDDEGTLLWVEDEDDRMMPTKGDLTKADRFDLNAAINFHGGYKEVRHFSVLSSFCSDLVIASYGVSLSSHTYPAQELPILIRTLFQGWNLENNFVSTEVKIREVDDTQILTVNALIVADDSIQQYVAGKSSAMNSLLLSFISDAQALAIILPTEADCKQKQWKLA